MGHLLPPLRTPRGRLDLVLVADPKQAIYAFKGANVHTYLEAAHRAGTGRVHARDELALRRRLARGARAGLFGVPPSETRGSKFSPVGPAPEHALRRLKGEDGSVLPALKVRLALGEEIPRNSSGEIQVDAAQRAIAHDLAEQVEELLDTAWLPPRGDGERRRIRPGDIAVLVGQHSESEIMQTALRRRGIPAVTTRADSVLKSPAAAQWRWLLSALSRPSDPTRARTAALTWFFGWSVTELDAADDAKLSGVQNQLAEWSETLADEGTVELCARVWSENLVAARVLATSDGDRNLTDLVHIASLMQAATVGRRPTPTGLLALLDQLEAEIAADPENDVNARQIESEAEAVQIMTIFVAKGLEFPVVCVPTMWRQGHALAHEVVYQDPITHERTFDIANGPGWPQTPRSKARKALADAEALGENLRLLYVAVTRSKHQTLLWWSGAKQRDHRARPCPFRQSGRRDRPRKVHGGQGVLA